MWDRLFPAFRQALRALGLWAWLRRTCIIALFLNSLLALAVLGAAPGARGVSSCDFPRYGWTRTVGHPDYFSEATEAVAFAPDGSVVLVGWYEGLPGQTVDFDPTKGVDLHPCRGCRDIFISKLAPDGSYCWTRTVGGRLHEQARAVAVDNEGNVLIAGSWGCFTIKPLTYVVDFDPTKGVDPHINIAGDRSTEDIFVTKLGPEGSYGWTHTFGGLSRDGGAGWDVGRAVGADSQGNIFITGHFSGTIDFDPGKGVDEHSSGQGHSLFLSKFGSDGSYKWTIDIGDESTTRAYGLGVGFDNSVVITGDFSGRVDFDPRRGVDYHDARDGHDVFVTKFKPHGGYAWTQTFGGDGDNEGWDAAVDRRGGVWVCGRFYRTVDFDPGPGVYERTDPGDGGIFVSRFTTSGDWRWSWVPQNSPEDERAYSVTLDRRGAGYITGEFGETVDFNPEGGGDRRTSNGGSDCFVTQLRRDGSYGWTGTMGGVDFDKAHGIASDPDGRIQIGGCFKFTVDFDPTEDVDYHTAHVNMPDLFTSKWSCASCDAVYSHNVEGKHGKSRSTLSTAVPGGKAKIKCKGHNGKATRKARLDDTGKGHVNVRPLLPGKYRCVIKRLRDAEGNPQCPGPASPRKVTVK